jgi:hypothetical protein
VAKIALWVACHTCGREFTSGLQMDERAFAKGTLAANYHACPHCGARGTYRKSDYQLRDAPLRERKPG